MKNRIFLCTVVLFSYYSFSQSYTQGVDEKLQLLDTSEITTHILYDRVYPMAELKRFNQSQADTSNTTHFYYAYAELQTADYLERWASVSQLKETVALQSAQNTIPIGLLHVDFEHLDENAYQDNLIGVQGADSLLVDIPGRPRSPYLTKTALVLSPLTEHTNSTTATFVMSADFGIRQSAAAITTIEADFNNGEGWQLLPAAGEFEVNFPAPGPYQIHFRVGLDDGTLYHTYASLKVYAAPPAPKKTEMQNRAAVVNSCTSGTIVSSRSFQGYTEAEAYSGTGEYEVFLGGADLDQPVIVVEGFDPLEGEGDEGNDIIDIYDFLKYNASDNIGDDLRALDYDIVLLNFTQYTAPNGKVINGGTDYIERNAMVLIDLIEQLNACKVGNQPLKIIGFSMGGLIARYALRYMELNGIPHETDLFVSVDSPHKGAVVPLGIQELADLVDDIVPFGAGNAADDILHTPAAKQMLIHHQLAHSQSPQGAPGFHEQFYTTLEAMGFPEQSRNIAIVNGTANGDPINTPGQNYVHANAGTGILGIFGAKVNTKLHYAPDRGLTRNVLKFKLKMALLLVDVTVYSRTRQVATPSGSGSYENAPGGFFDVAGLTREFLGDNDLFLYSKGTYASFFIHTYLSLDLPNFSFIPVKSALAYEGDNLDLYQDFSARNLVCAGETPFDSYYIPPENQRHTSLTASSVNFITEEILGNIQHPNLDVNGEEIILGASVVCNTDTVFILKECSANGVNWSVSTNLQIVGTTPSTITVRAANNAIRGYATITAEAPDQGVMQKQVYVGKPQRPSGNITGPANVTPGMLVNYHGRPAEGATAYEWRVPYPYTEGGALDISNPNWNIRSANGYQTVNVFTGTQANSGLVQLMGKNKCGCGSARTLHVNAPAPPPPPDVNGGVPAPEGGIPSPLPPSENAVETVESNALEVLELYPNPSATTAVVALHSSLAEQGRSIKKIALYTIAGNLIKTVVPAPGQHKITMHVVDLPRGLYQLHIWIDQELQHRKLILE